MGFKRDRVYLLKFEDPDLNGLEVRARSVPLKKFLDLISLSEVDTGKASTRESVENAIRMFADVLISWNVEDADGNPVPATLDGLYSQDFEFVVQIIKAWQDSISGVSDPLARRSSGGERSLEESIPMETL